MMKIKTKNAWAVILTASMGALTVFAGCQTPIDHPNEPIPAVFTATIAGEAATKTLLAAVPAGSPRDVLWKDGDQVIVGDQIYKAGNVTNGGVTATLAMTASEAVMDGGVYKAYYPAGSTGIYNVSTKALTLQPAHTYVAPVSSDGNRVVAAHLPMYAESSTRDLTFRNLCAVLSLRLTGTKQVTRIVVASTSKALSGPFTIGGTADDPTVSMTSTYATYRNVTLNCAPAVQLTDTPVEFCIPVPAGSYDQNDLTVTVYSGSYIINSYKNAAAAGSTLKRSHIYEITADSNWIRKDATTTGHNVNGFYDQNTTNLNSTWTK